MPKLNEFTEVVLSIKDELSHAKKEASKVNPVRFGDERLSAKQASARYSQMSRGEIERLTPDQRKDMIKLVGIDTVITRLRGSPGV